MSLSVIEPDSESPLQKDLFESGPEPWSDVSPLSQDTPRTSYELSPSIPEEAPDLSNQMSLSPQDKSLSPVSAKGGFNVWTNEQRKDACVAFVIYGKADKVAELTGVPIRTVYNWIKADWWPRMLDEAKRDHQDLIEARLSNIVDLATNSLIDRILYGEPKTRIVKGKVQEYRNPLGAKELNTIVAQMADRLRTMRNQPTRIQEERKFDMDKIARTFAEIAEKNRDRIVSSQ